MRIDAEGKLIQAHILHILAGSAALSVIAVLIRVVGVVVLRRVQEGQANGIVVILIHAVFAVVENRNAEGSVLVRDVRPFLNRNLRLVVVIIRALDRAEAEVIGRGRVACGQIELRLQQFALLLPIDRVVHTDNLASGGKADYLRICRIAVRAGKLDRHTGRTFLQNLDARVGDIIVPELGGIILKIQLPCSPVDVAFIKQREPDGIAENLLIQLLVGDAGDIAVFVNIHLVFVVGKLGSANAQPGLDLRRNAGGQHRVGAVSHRADRGDKDNLVLICDAAVDLRGYLVALIVENANIRQRRIQRQRALDRVGQRVTDNHRNCLRLRRTGIH